MCNFLITIDTSSVFARIDSAQRRIDLLQPNLPAAIGFLRHRLRLQRIHPRQTTHLALIELDGSGRPVAGLPDPQNLITLRDQSRAKELPIAIIMAIVISIVAIIRHNNSPW